MHAIPAIEREIEQVCVCVFVYVCHRVWRCSLAQWDLLSLSFFHDALLAVTDTPIFPQMIENQREGRAQYHLSEVREATFLFSFRLFIYDRGYKP